jgi:hypothetical protein
LSDTCHRLAVGVTIVGGGGDLALKGARAGPCDDEDKMCCQRERMRKEIKMSPLKFTKSVVIGVFNGSHCIFTTYSSPKGQNRGTTGYFPLFQRIVCTLIANLGEIFGIPANLDFNCKFWTVSIAKTDDPASEMREMNLRVIQTLISSHKEEVS